MTEFQPRQDWSQRMWFSHLEALLEAFPKAGPVQKFHLLKEFAPMIAGDFGGRSWERSCAELVAAIRRAIGEF